MRLATQKDRKTRESSLDLMWSAYHIYRTKQTEDSQRNPSKLSNPRWCPQCGSTTVLENELTGTNAVVTTTSYIHSDHLGGTNVTSDQNGLATEIVDFLPYGAERFRDGDSQDQRQFAGTERDTESDLDLKR